jgi:antitoxin PrlF
MHYHGRFVHPAIPVMRATLELESTLTDRYQTTVPDSVRRALRLGKRDKIRYLVQGDGTVVLTRGGAAGEDDPVLAEFLRFLANDIAARPGRVRSLDRKLAARVRSLVRGVKVKLDEPLEPEGK